MDGLATLRYLALPLHAASLLLVALFSVLLRLALHAGLLGLPALLIIGSWFFKYAFVLIDHAAQGRPGAPVLSVEDANPLGETRPLLYGMGLGVFYMATAALGEFTSPGLVTALRLLGLLALPAILAVHTITGSFTEALNPATVVGVARRLGSAYLVVLCVALACGWAGRAIVLDGGQLAVLLRIALLMLLWLALFAVLGGAIHVRRVELGFEPEHSPEKRVRRNERDRDRERDHFLDRVFAEFRAGARGNPFATIQQRANQSLNPLAEYLWIHDRVATWPNPKLSSRIAQELLPLLLGSNRNSEALRVARSQLQADEHFRPLASDSLLRLVELARDAGDRPLARALLSDFARHYPDDPLAKRAQRLAAELPR
jgi:hypothetical protein